MPRTEVVDCLVLEVHPPRLALGRCAAEALQRVPFEALRASEDAMLLAESGTAASEAVHPARFSDGQDMPGMPAASLAFLPSESRKNIVGVGAPARPLLVPWRSELWTGTQSRWPSTETDFRVPPRMDKLRLVRIE